MNGVNGTSTRTGASALSSGLSLNTAQIGGIIAAGIGALIILSGIIFAILRKQRKGRLATSTHHQRHIAPHFGGTGKTTLNKNASPDPQSSSIAVTPPVGGGAGFVVYPGAQQPRSSSSSKASSRSSPIDNMHGACDTDSASLQHDAPIGVVTGGEPSRAGVAANIRLFEQTKTNNNNNGGNRRNSGGSYNVPAATAAATTNNGVVAVIAPIKNGQQIHVARFGGNTMSSVVSTNVVGEV